MERKATEEGRNGYENDKDSIRDKHEEEGGEEKERKKKYKLESLELESVKEVRNIDGYPNDGASGAGTATDAVTVDWRQVVGTTHPSPVDSNWMLTNRYKKNFSSGCIMNDLSHHKDDNETPSYAYVESTDL